MTENRGVKDKILLFIKGFCMGTADVIPGVSGGTMAFILGIYSDLIRAIRSFDLVWLKSVVRFELREIFERPHYSFLIPLLTGIFCALLFFTRVISLPNLLMEYPEQIYGLFFGLIAGSIFIMFQDMATFDLKAVVPLVAGVILGALVFNMVPTQTPETSWFVFLSGSLAICAMILPGISGSFVLLILNKYTYIFNAIGYFKFEILLPFTLGAITGLAVFSRILYYLLRRFYRNTVLIIIGVLVASLWVIWPFQERIPATIGHKTQVFNSVPFFPAELSDSVIFAFIFMITGFITVFIINRIAMVKVKQTDS
jgi:putative membrane protein